MRVCACGKQISCLYILSHSLYSLSLLLLPYYHTILLHAAYCELMHFFMRSLTHSCSLELSSKDYQLKPCLKYQQTSSESSPDVETLSCSTTQAGEGVRVCVCVCISCVHDGECN
jgi:hypothetical protein